MSHNHYFRDVSKLQSLDVYRLLDLFDVTCPVAQHVVKKALAAGQRGHKSMHKDWKDIADSAARKLQMMREDDGWTQEPIKAASFSQEDNAPAWPDDPKWQWMAQDVGGDVWAYTEEPQIGEEQWFTRAAEVIRIGYGDNNPKWRTTLRQRPSIQE